jgi:chromosome segregation ATPase
MVRHSLRLPKQGTGKSTVVCAIALGLADKPDVLGRQKELQEFIRHGQQTAMISVELKGNENNIIIQRKFERGKNSSEWKVNGKNLILS